MGLNKPISAHIDRIRPTIPKEASHPRLL